MERRRLGGRDVYPIALGTAKLSLGDDRPSKRDAIRTVHAALDAGVTVIDTASIYRRPQEEMYSERLVGRALREWPGDVESVTVVAKGGQEWDRDGRPVLRADADGLRSACEGALSALGISSLAVYVLHRLPRQYFDETPAAAEVNEAVQESVETLVALRQEGKVQQIGLSNVTYDTLSQIGPLAHIGAVQNPLSAMHPPRKDELEFCEGTGATFLAWGPLRGVVTRTADDDRGARSRVEAIRAIASQRGVSPESVALAWELSVSPCVVPIVGATRPETIADSVSAADAVLTPDELSQIWHRGHAAPRSRAERDRSR